MDNPAYSAPRSLEVPGGEYLHYSAERSNSSEGNFNLGYHRSSSSSSSAGSGGSGKQLVHSHNQPRSTPLFGRFDRRNQHKEERFSFRVTSPTDSSSSASSPEIHKKPKKFYIGTPSSPGSSRGSSSPRQSSPELPSTPVTSSKFSKFPNTLSPTFSYDHERVPSPNPVKKSSIYVNYWHVPRSNLWCNHKECSFGNKCTQCALKEETGSSCSSENPPPTFTACDNYQPVRRKPKKCSCGAVFCATMGLSVIVLLLITAFIIYVELVLKRNDYIPEPM